MFFGADALARLLMPQEMAERPKRAQDGGSPRFGRVADGPGGAARKKPDSEGASGSRKRPVGSKT
jgi:hypothetical protein